MGATARKILLFVDNAPCHPPDMACLPNIKVVFLPPNCTNCLQLRDAEIIKCMKQGYRKRLVQCQPATTEPSEEKKISLLAAMQAIASSWSAVSQTTISNSFQHCGFARETVSTAGDSTFSMDEYSSAIHENDFERLKPAKTFAEFVEANDNVASCGELWLHESVTEELLGGNTTATSNEDNAAAADSAVPTSFADMLVHIDGIRSTFVHAMPRRTCFWTFPKPVW
ncbi:hypothetical protein HPB51_021930 [Rhipicephalus microplus]|uniref:DDE-1 domain-containing protein n=1 Tax=Rhipicephalus microplus TaxID=6941 RepID=A0A9J6EP47_RHIMP|nr:hypothetical protein HPB51_021930 [Rhipicephalus microplus]